MISKYYKMGFSAASRLKIGDTFKSIRNMPKYNSSTRPYGNNLIQYTQGAKDYMQQNKKYPVTDKKNIIIAFTEYEPEGIAKIVYNQYIDAI